MQTAAQLRLPTLLLLLLLILSLLLLLLLLLAAAAAAAADLWVRSPVVAKPPGGVRWLANPIWRPWRWGFSASLRLSSEWNLGVWVLP